METEEELRKKMQALCDKRDRTLAQNVERMKSLGLAKISADLNASTKSSPAEKQRKKRDGPTIPESTRELRSKTIIPRPDNEDDSENILDDHLEEDEVLGLDDQQKKKRNGQKRTRMHIVYDRVNKPPVSVSFNEKGQPDGENASEFSNFIATLVKTHIPLGHEDWRLVDVEKKNELMTTLKKYYVVDDKLNDYVMGSAHKKWRDFKADLKHRFFEPEKTDEELYALRVNDNRVSVDDWEWLIKFWRSEESKKRSEQGKNNRMAKKVLHRSGSKSHARVTTELHKEKGYAPRRDEVFVRTHMGKDGTVLNEETAKVIKDIDDAMEKHPELLEKSIQQGDILSHVLGKERNGYVRCVGLGTTASSLGMPGAQKLKSTKLQMAELEAEKARQSNNSLRNQIDEIREDTKAQIDIMMEEIANLRGMISQSNAGNDIMMHISEIQPEASIGEHSTADQSLNDDHYINEEDVMMQELKEAQEQYEKKKAEAELLIRKKVAAQRLNNETEIQQKNRKEAELQRRKGDELLKKRKEDELLKKRKEDELLKKRKEDELLKKRKEDELLKKRKEDELLKKRKEDELLKKRQEDELLKKKKGEDMVAKKKDQDLQKKRETELQKKKETTTTQKNNQAGKEVILYNVYRDHSTPVAKATILSTDRKKMVGGHELGTECCEVVVDYIVKRDAILPRPIGNVKTIGQAQGRTIAWPYKHMEVDMSKTKQASPPQAE